MVTLAQNGCPTCMRRPLTPACGLQVYASTVCIVCQDDAESPMVALPCGHLLCVTHFERLGGSLAPQAEMLSRPPLGSGEASRPESAQSSASRLLMELEEMFRDDDWSEDDVPRSPSARDLVQLLQVSPRSAVLRSPAAAVVERRERRERAARQRLLSFESAEGSQDEDSEGLLLSLWRDARALAARSASGAHAYSREQDGAVSSDEEVPTAAFTARPSMQLPAPPPELAPAGPANAAPLAAANTAQPLGAAAGAATSAANRGAPSPPSAAPARSDRSAAAICAAAVAAARLRALEEGLCEGSSDEITRSARTPPDDSPLFSSRRRRAPPRTEAAVASARSAASFASNALASTLAAGSGLAAMTSRSMTSAGSVGLEVPPAAPWPGGLTGVAGHGALVSASDGAPRSGRNALRSMPSSSSFGDARDAEGSASTYGTGAFGSGLMSCSAPTGTFRNSLAQLLLLREDDDAGSLSGHESFYASSCSSESWMFNHREP